MFQRIYERIDEDVGEDQNDGDVVERIGELDATQLKHNNDTVLVVSKYEKVIMNLSIKQFIQFSGQILQVSISYMINNDR